MAEETKQSGSGDAQVDFELAELDEDLRAPFVGRRWEYVDGHGLVQVQICRHLRALVSVLKEREQREQHLKKGEADAHQG